MNVHVRFRAVTILAALTLGAIPLAAQSASTDARTASSALSAIGMIPNAVVDSITAVAATDTTATPVAAISRGPSIANARVASHAVSSPRGAPPVLQNNKSHRNAAALMIVGGAALLVGAIIGNDAGTIVMLGGAGIGLYGLYLFLT